MPIPQQIFTVPGKFLPPPREVIIEQEEEDEAPQEIIIERWLAYPKQQRKVVFESSNGQQQDYIVTEADDDTLKNHLKRLGMSEHDLQKINWDSFDLDHSKLDANTKRNLIYQSAPIIQPQQQQLTAKNIFIDWEYDSSAANSPREHLGYSQQAVDIGGSLGSSERHSNSNNSSSIDNDNSKQGYDHHYYDKNVTNFNSRNVKFLGIETVDPLEYAQRHGSELIDPSKFPEYFKSLKLPMSLVGEEHLLAANRNSVLSFDFTGDVEALDLVSDKNLYKF